MLHLKKIVIIKDKRCFSSRITPTSFNLILSLSIFVWPISLSGLFLKHLLCLSVMFSAPLSCLRAQGGHKDRKDAFTWKLCKKIHLASFSISSDQYTMNISACPGRGIEYKSLWPAYIALPKYRFMTRWDVL